MKARLITEVWVGEFDPSEFTSGATTSPSETPNHLIVTEVVELGFLHEHGFISLGSALAGGAGTKVELLLSED